MINQCHTGSDGEDPPDQSWNNGQHGHADQDDRDPLVVADQLSRFPLLVDHLRYPILEGYIERVRNPTDAVRVVPMTLREVGWTPTVDRLPDKLFCRDDDGADDEERCREYSRKSVAEVIILSSLDVLDAHDRLKDFFHLGQTSISFVCLFIYLFISFVYTSCTRLVTA